MGIAVAQFGPAVDLAIGAHGDAICMDAAEAGIPRLDAVKPEIMVCIDAIKHFALATMAENAIQWMSDDSQAALLMHKVDAALHTQAGLNAFLDEERQEMTIPGADLLAYNKIEAILALSPEIARAQRPFDYVVISQRDYRQVCIVLGMVQNLLDSTNTVTVSAMHMQISPPRLAV